MQRLNLYPLLEFLEDSTLTKQLLPTLKLGYQVMRGPAERFRNITFAEFIYADTLFGFFSKTQKEFTSKATSERISTSTWVVV
ncbi:hypothetical protein ACMA1I_22990 [Pontibacter sp. 13R65]|uniref:hypothetical protein n=1 Tax=Pontibacter sp. 13R65 TaxID=3127458 RepID=UPI00301DBEA0